MVKEMSWTNVIGRVAFTNCDPLFFGLDERWSILSAPPAWLTGHVLRKDCLTAPIPTADFAKHQDELMLVPDLGIVAMGAVGSVILFGSRELDQMRDIALPSDSSTSKVLLRWLLNHRGLDPKLCGNRTRLEINARFMRWCITHWRQSAFSSHTTSRTSLTRFGRGMDESYQSSYGFWCVCLQKRCTYRANSTNS